MLVPLALFDSFDSNTSNDCKAQFVEVNTRKTLAFLKTWSAILFNRHYAMIFEETLLLAKQLFFLLDVSKTL